MYLLDSGWSSPPTPPFTASRIPPNGKRGNGSARFSCAPTVTTGCAASSPHADASATGPATLRKSPGSMFATSAVQARECTSEAVTWLENEFERVWRERGRKEIVYRHGSLLYMWNVYGVDAHRPPLIGLKPDGITGWCR